MCTLAAITTILTRQCRSTIQAHFGWLNVAINDGRLPHKSSRDVNTFGKDRSYLLSHFFGWAGEIGFEIAVRFELVECDPSRSTRFIIVGDKSGGAQHTRNGQHFLNMLAKPFVELDDVYAVECMGDLVSWPVLICHTLALGWLFLARLFGGTFLFTSGRLFHNLFRGCLLGRHICRTLHLHHRDGFPRFL